MEQLVARLVHIQKVIGSTPIGASNHPTTMKMTLALIAFLLFLPSCANLRGITVHGRYGEYTVDRTGTVTITPKLPVEIVEEK